MQRLPWTLSGHAGRYDSRQMNDRMMELKVRFGRPESRLWRAMCGILLAFELLIPGACSSDRGALARRVFSDPTAAQLAEASASGDPRRIAELIKAGADPSAVGDKRTSMLQWAVLNQSGAGEDALLTAGADPNHADEDGNTVMNYAARAKDPKFLDILLAHHVNPDLANPITKATALKDALFGNADVQFRTLLGAGADPNRVEDTVGDTILHTAASINSAHVLDLLQAGADPMARNNRNETFQRLFTLTPERTMSNEGRRNRHNVAAWLRRHAIPLEYGLH